MSETVDMNKKSLKKSSLGRGLGSLLGDGESTMKVAPALREGFMEKPEQAKPIQRPVPVAQQPVVTQVATPAVAAAPVVVAAPVVAPAPKIPDTARIWQIAVDKLSANPNQPRQTFEKEALEELSRSIKEKGILQPIAARKKADGSFEIIAGERRWRAAQQAGLHEVPVILRESADQDALELALIENIQRRDLNPMEEAEAFAHLIDTYKITQQQLADKIGKERVSIANTLRLLNLGTDVRAMVSSGELSMGHAKVLLMTPDFKLQKQLAVKSIKEKLSVRALEKLITKSMQDLEVEKGGDTTAAVANRLAHNLAEELQKVVGTKVQIDYAQGKGKVSLFFYSDEELNKIAENIKDSWDR